MTNQNWELEAPLFAKTRDGIDLPVIDLTDPRFGVPNDPDAARARYREFTEMQRKRGRMPKFVMRMMMRSAAKRSRLVGALFSSPKGFLDGVSTYVMKLGAENLVPPYNTRIDRKFASSPHIPLLRLRMQQTAQLLCDALVEDLTNTGDQPVSLINIGGGPALDSINALILLNRSRPDLLKRPFAIHVLDLDDAGPFFGANALEALRHPGRPLHGVAASLRHRRYDWNETTPLQDLTAQLIADRTVIVASSEGALFEYGSDEAIVANLTALRADGRGARHVVGSVTRADDTRKRMIAETRFHITPRGVEGFVPLAAKAGFAVARTESAMLSDQVLLTAVAARGGQ